MPQHNCRLCDHTGFYEVIDLGRLPIAHKLLAHPYDEEQCYPLSLHCCESCGLIQILEPIDPNLLYLDYNFCFSSWKAQPHVIDEIKMLSRLESRASVFEIGCNDGMFLEALRENGFPKVEGLEPNPYAARQAAHKGFPVHVSSLEPAQCREITAESGKFKIVAARQVIEHLCDLHGFFESVDLLLSEDGFLLLEFPDFASALRIGEISMVWEEHVNYFTLDAARSLLKRHGFEPIEISHFNFAGGSLAILARRSAIREWAAPSPDLASIHSFRNRVAAYREKLTRLVTAARKMGLTPFIYGSGCRACTFINGHRIGDLLDFAVDDQKERQGLFLPGSCLEIHPFSRLEELRAPALCLLGVSVENEPLVMEGRLSLFPDLKTISIFAPADIWEELRRVDVLMERTMAQKKNT